MKLPSTYTLAVPRSSVYSDLFVMCACNTRISQRPKGMIE
jgi:hypothetical protein